MQHKLKLVPSENQFMECLFDILAFIIVMGAMTFIVWIAA